MSYKDLTIGIWGAGIVAISALHFYKKQGARLSIYSDRLPASDVIDLCHHYAVHVYSPQELDLFLQESHYILPSAGIDLRPYIKYDYKFLNEADIFFTLYKKPIIAVSGTLGKTTVTAAIKFMLENYGYRIQIGGNIGIGLFDLLDDQDHYDYAVLELSSFQLERSKIFAPHIAIWTNLYPNHLDRHNSLQEYFSAKYSLIKNQCSQDYALIHESVRPYLTTNTLSNTTYFSSTLPEPLAALIYEYKTHREHYIILYNVARLLNLDTKKLIPIFNNLNIPEHRVKHIGTHNMIDFYDDSKSTVVESTLGALSRFPDRPVILFFGGVSKGVNREYFFKDIPQQVRHILFFGKEAVQLYSSCQDTFFGKSFHPDLESAFDHCTVIMKDNDVVLFSPGGASFDLFADYKQRGKTFQALVTQFIS